MKEIIKAMVEHLFYDLPETINEFNETLGELENALLGDKKNIVKEEFKQFAEIFEDTLILGKIPSQHPLSVGTIRWVLLEIVNESIQQHVKNAGLQIDQNIWVFENIKLKLADLFRDDRILNQEENQYVQDANPLNDEGDILAAVNEDEALGYNEAQLEGIRIGLSHEDIMQPNFGYHTIYAIANAHNNSFTIQDAASMYKNLTFDEIYAKNSGNYNGANNVNAHIDFTEIQHNGLELGYSPEQVMHHNFGSDIITATKILLAQNESLENFSSTLLEATEDNVNFTVDFILEMLGNS